MKLLTRNLLIVVLMVGASALAAALQPTQRMGDLRPPFDLDHIIPEQFGEWRREALPVAQIVDPQMQQSLDMLYSTVFAHNSVNARGERVMLSIAYGKEQTKQSQVHLPEVCYPAQGFRIANRHKAELLAAEGSIPVMRMVATAGGRTEPITYWIRLGDAIVRGGLEQKLLTVREGLAGRIPDGLLFRVSSLGADTQAAYTVHQQFVDQLLRAVPPEQLPLLVGGASGT